MVTSDQPYPNESIGGIYDLDLGASCSTTFHYCSSSSRPNRNLSSCRQSFDKTDDGAQIKTRRRSEQTELIESVPDSIVTYPDIDVEQLRSPGEQSSPSQRDRRTSQTRTIHNHRSHVRSVLCGDRHPRSVRPWRMADGSPSISASARHVTKRLFTAFQTLLYHYGLTRGYARSVMGDWWFDESVSSDPTHP